MALPPEVYEARRPRKTAYSLLFLACFNNQWHVLEGYTCPLLDYWE